MLQLLLLMLVVQPSPSPGAGLPEQSILLRDRAQGPTPVTDKDLRPIKAPDCRTEAEIQKTLEQLSYGEPGDCFIRDIRRFDRQSY
jgi:hypothetical protein